MICAFRPHQKITGELAAQTLKPQVKTMDDIDPAYDPRVLLDCFEYMFTDPHARFDFYRGWMPMTVRVCEAIDAVLGNDKRDFRWAQIKEKFGEARFYYYVQSSSAQDVEIITTKTPVGATVKVAPNPADPVAREIANIVAKAQDESRSTCQVCGESAATRGYGGYWVTLCPTHQPKGPEDTTWHDAVVRARMGPG